MANALREAFRESLCGVMAKSSDKTTVYLDNNDRPQGKKRKRSLSPEAESEEQLSKYAKVAGDAKVWKKASSADLQPELLEEMGVGMLPDASEEDKSVEEHIISSSEDSENKHSTLKNQKKMRKRKKLKRQPLKYLCGETNTTANTGLPTREKSGIEVCSGEKTVDLDSDDATRDDKEDSDDCFIDDSATKENSKNLKWEKLKPVSCKIRNSKIIYQNETTMITEAKNTSQNKVEQVRKSRTERKVQEDEEGDFFICRRPKALVITGEDHFKKLADEVILSVFRWLPKKSLVSCAMACKRFLSLAYDEELWTRMDLGGRNLPPKAVGHILARGFRILRLAQAALPDPVFCPKSTFLPKDFTCKLQYLDLSMASISASGLAVFVSFCKNLKKLSLENCHVNNACAAAIAGNVELEVLNLTMCMGLTTTGVEAILTKCRRLTSLNVAWTLLTKPALDVLACKVPSRLERLNISGCRKNLTNEHVIEILHRCEDLIELDVSDSVDLTDQVISFIVQFVKKIEYLSFSRCYSINAASFLSLKHVESLMYLDIFGLMTEEEINEMKSKFTDVAINQFMFSSVARPTVGVRRTSIWGLRVRD